MPPSKIEREVEEILSRLEELPAARRQRPSLTRRLRARAGRFAEEARRHFPRLTVGHLMLTAMGFILVSWLLSRASDGSGRYLLFAGLALFLLAFLLSLRRRGAGGGQLYWRGRPVQVERPGWLGRLRIWWHRPR